MKNYNINFIVTHKSGQKWVSVPTLSTEAKLGTVITAVEDLNGGTMQMRVDGVMHYFQAKYLSDCVIAINATEVNGGQ